uniref:Uncharacterized protein n=1 Tax=Anguilla anguilla TaxID=7936 RepID=A0A0E9T336_ANGAN
MCTGNCDGKGAILHTGTSLTTADF